MFNLILHSYIKEIIKTCLVKLTLPTQKPLRKQGFLEKLGQEPSFIITNILKILENKEYIQGLKNEIKLLNSFS